VIRGENKNLLKEREEGGKTEGISSTTLSVKNLEGGGKK